MTIEHCSELDLNDPDPSVCHSCDDGYYWEPLAKECQLCDGPNVLPHCFKCKNPFKCEVCEESFEVNKDGACW